MRDGSSIDPQRHTSSSLRTRLQVIDDQCRLFLVVDVETRAFPTHVDLDLGPDGRQQVDVDSSSPGFPCEAETRASPGVRCAERRDCAALGRLRGRLSAEGKTRHTS